MIQRRDAFASGNVRFTPHARVEMADEAISVEELLEAVATGAVLEDYPDYRRGACCLLSGETPVRRPVHLVCSTDLPIVVITVYEPVPPKWVDRFTRGGSP